MRSRVIGVVADTRINGLKDDAAMVYLPYWAYTPWTLSFLVRSSQPSDALIPEMRRALWQIDPQVAIPTLKSMDEQVSDSVATDRSRLWCSASFGAAALLLALLGVYGVLAYSVSLRRQEFGIRIALGSGKSALIGLVLRQAAYPVLLGTGIGLYDGADRAALGAQSALSNLRHGPARGGRQRIVALGCRRDRGDHTGPARSIDRPDACAENRSELPNLAQHTHLTLHSPHRAQGKAKDS